MLSKKDGKPGSVLAHRGSPAGLCSARWLALKLPSVTYLQCNREPVNLDSKPAAAIRKCF